MRSIDMHTPDFEGTAKLFMNGRSQAVRLPVECRFEGTEVYIRKVGDTVVLAPRPANWDAYFASADRPTDDFMATRVDLAPESREFLKWK